MNIRGALVGLTTAASLALLVACGSSPQGGSSSPPPPAGLPGQGVISQVPLGQVAGAGQSPRVLATRNPFAGNPQAVQEGKALYIKMNCAGCHAYGGTGNMGPDLTDAAWLYGGLPIQIYNSIHDGRPQGMPAWGSALPPQDIWKIVAYIQSLGGSYPASDYEHAPQGDQPGDRVAAGAYSPKEPYPVISQPPSATASP